MTTDSRLDAVRRRERLVKIGVGVAVPGVFLAAMGLARATYAGHPKKPARPLAVPQSLYTVVRQNLLQGGVLAPAKAPPDATTSSS